MNSYLAKYKLDVDHSKPSLWTLIVYSAVHDISKCTAAVKLNFSPSQWWVVFRFSLFTTSVSKLRPLLAIIMMMNIAHCETEMANLSPCRICIADVAYVGKAGWAEQAEHMLELLILIGALDNHWSHVPALCCSPVSKILFFREYIALANVIKEWHQERNLMD